MQNSAQLGFLYTDGGQCFGKRYFYFYLKNTKVGYKQGQTFAVLMLLKNVFVLHEDFNTSSSLNNDHTK